jgi:hypothetical protein
MIGLGNYSDMQAGYEIQLGLFDNGELPGLELSLAGRPGVDKTAAQEEARTSPMKGDCGPGLRSGAAEFETESSSVLGYGVGSGQSTE